MSPLVASIVQSIVILAVAPFAIGLVRKSKAFFQNRRGASVLQPYWALAALMKKEMTITTHASWVFHAVPFAVLGSAFALVLLIPTLMTGTAAGVQGNVFLIAGLLAVGALFLVLGGMDVASAFGGMGSSREMTLAALTEPALLLVFAAFGYVSGAWTADGQTVFFSAHQWLSAHPFLILSIVALGAIVLSENARYPVDNPATHLELTMVHEAMVLEYSGPYLAFLEYASALKLTVLGIFFMNLLLPFGIADASVFVSLLPGSIFFLGKLIAVCVGIAFIESTIAKMRFYRMQEYMFSAYVLAFFGFILTAIF